jgi:sugar lactone lactonase YvrE
MSFSKISLLSVVTAFLLTPAIYSFYFSAPGSAKGLGGTSVTIIATDLHNPRGLNFGPDGGLYVAEAGTNGPHNGMCRVMGDGSMKCYSTTGSITRIDLEKETVDRIIEGLPSLISPSGTPNVGIGNGATGAHDVSFNGLGNSYVSIGLGGNPVWRADFGDGGALLGRLARFNPSGKFRYYEDLAGYELENNPDGFVPDSNPYGLLARPGKVIYADAGGNTLNQVTARGTITTLAVFPNLMVPAPIPPSPSPTPTPGTMVPVQAVPTSVALGPDGNYYVGQLTGFPFTVGAANIYRVPPGGGVPEVAYSGFTNIIDITFGPDGSLYVLEIARLAIPRFGMGGRLVRIAPDGTQTNIISGPPLIAPGGVVVGSDGAIYVTNNSTSALMGQVLKIEP